MLFNEKDILPTELPDHLESIKITTNPPNSQQLIYG